MSGVDLSPELIERARHLNPAIEFRQGDMRALDLPNEVYTGLVAFYSLIHIPRAEMGRALRELSRVLRPDGLFLLGFHVGEETIHLDE